MPNFIIISGFIKKEFPALAEKENKQLLRHYVQPQLQAAIVKICKYYRSRNRHPSSSTSASSAGSASQEEDDDDEDDFDSSNNDEVTGDELQF